MNSDQLGNLRPLIRKAAHGLVGGGWRATTTGLVFHGPEGHWGRIDAVNRDAAMSARSARVPIQLYAGIASPYLLRAVNRRDPDKAPPQGYSHAWLLFQVEVRYDDASMTAPAPLTLPQATWAETGIVLGPSHAATWFIDMFGLLVKRVEELASDLALRDFLLRNCGKTDFMSVRFAALLTKRLGRIAELPGLLALDGEALEAAKALGGELPGTIATPTW